MDKTSQPVSEHIRKINRVISFVYRNAWKNKDIPRKQLVLVEDALSIYRSGGTFEAFDVAVNLIKKIHLPPASLLEVGCSSGYYGEVFKIANLDVSYFGCDYSSEFIKLAKSRYPDINFKVSDATSLDYRSKSFDVVMLGGVLLHISNWKEALKEAARVSRRYLLIHRHPVLYFNPTQIYLKKGYGVKMFEVIFNESEFMEEVRKCGYAIIAISSLSSSTLKGIDEKFYMKSYLAERVATKLSPKPK